MQPRSRRPPAVAPACAPEELVGFWVNRASRTLLRALDARLRPFGLAMSQLPVLRALAEAGPLSQKALAGHARVEQPTMAELLARMERDGLVQRAPNPDDKRGSLASLTRSARARVPKATAALIACEHTAFAGFTAAERAQLARLLQRMIGNLEASADPRSDDSPGA